MERLIIEGSLIVYPMDRQNKNDRWITFLEASYQI